MNNTRNTKILSFFLSLLMVFSVFTCLTLPSMAEEESTEQEGTAEDVVIDGEEAVEEYLTVEEALTTYLTKEFTSREEKLASMTLRLTKGDIELYCDAKSGEVAIKNTKTGQILLSNPYDVSTVESDNIKAQLLSQVSITYKDLLNMGVSNTKYSFTDSAQRGQIDVMNIKNGLRVEYTIGKDAVKKLMPLWIEASRMETMILPNIPEGRTYNEFMTYYTRIDIDEQTLTTRIEEFKESFPVVGDTYSGVGYIPTVTETTVKQLNGSEKTYTYSADKHVAIYVLTSEAVASERQSNMFESYTKAYCPDYSYSEQEFDINLCRYVGEDGVLAIFKLALEYYLTDNGFEVRLPANGIRFDEDAFQLTDVTVLPYMGTTSNDFTGYTFIPDGSGTIIRNEDIVASNRVYTVSGQVYGPDYAYHNIVANYNGKSELMRLPVFGAIEDTIYNGEQLKDENGELLFENVYQKDAITGEFLFDANGNKIPVYIQYEGEPVQPMEDPETGEILYWKESDLEKVPASEVPADPENPEGETPEDETPEGETPDAETPDQSAEGGANAQAAADNEGEAGTEGETEDDTEYVWQFKYDENGAIVGTGIPLYKGNTNAEGVTIYYIVDENGNRIQKTEPVFEQNTISQGFVAIVNSGESLTKITSAHGGNVDHKYNSAYATFYPLSTDTYNLRDSIEVGSDEAWSVTSERKYTGAFQIRVILVSDYENSKYEGSYVGMAKAYQDYLIENQGLEKISDAATDIPLYIESFGMLETQGSFLTIPIWVDTPLTTTTDVQSMYGKLAEKNVTNVNFRLTGFTKGGMDYHLAPTKVEFENVVGGKDGYNKLVEDAQAKGYGVFPDFDFAYFDGSAWFDGFDQSNWTVRTIDDRYANKREYDAIYQTFMYVGTVAISPWAYDQMFDKFIDEMSDYKVDGISFATLGSDLNSDFDEDDPYNREDNKQYTVDLLKQLSEKYDNIMVDGGNAYALGYVDHILNLPLDGSRYLRSSQSVPFTGIVLHGYVNYAGTPTNMEGDIDYEILKIIENGAAPYFILSAQNTNELKDWVNLAKYYSVNFDIWFEDMVEIYNTLNEALRDVQTAPITDHEFIDGTRVLSEAEKAQVEAEEAEAKAEYDELRENELKAAIKAALEAGEITTEEEFDVEAFDEGRATFDEYYTPDLDVVIDDHTIVYETYENGVAFLLNYNYFDVTVEVNGTTYTISALDFVKLDAQGNIVIPKA